MLQLLFDGQLLRDTRLHNDTDDESLMNSLWDKIIKLAAITQKHSTSLM